MAKSKKPKKKYRPREVFIPSILNAHFTFQPFEDALKRLVETGEMDIDENEIPIYKDVYGKAQSFESGLKIYIRFISVYSECIELNINTKPFETLLQALREGFVLEEENIEDVMRCFKACRELVAITSPKTMTLLMQQVRKEMNEEKIAEIAQRNQDLYVEKAPMDLPESGPASWYTDPFATAVMDDASRDRIYNTASELTNGDFHKYFDHETDVTSDRNRVPRDLSE